MTLDIISWICILAAMLTIAIRTRPSITFSQYKVLSSLFWLFMAGSLACSIFQSETWWKWLWLALTILALAAAVHPPEVSMRQQQDQV
ncbi:MAG: hypothetical protein QM774_00745 [Gordonia sp. (in: high G+C Gram-positive bacteria)]|uniref:hypothetical protein n=1 Tax=Gordonia sp. (in: high G+C Gram-positive bacteria) TaxID=84139 RepID=UPI0039E27B23